ncbi:MAG: MBL fold metallo-hydrolase [Deltaproteobacteria bacterium]|nr:MBL fold metallo-hydrolase [Deltaproteobacteria bacterium]
MIIETYSAGSFGCNAIILGDRLLNQAVVVDPGDAVQETLSRLKRLRLHAVAIVHTHAHVDHTMGSALLSELTGAPTYLHPGDTKLHACMDMQAMELGLRLDVSTPMDKALKDMSCIEFGRFQLGVIHTPGHTPGSVCLEVPGQNLCLTGDTLFKGGIGRTTRWGGDPDQLKKSIRHRLYGMHGSVQILPGHGDPSTIDYERLTNPYVRKTLV